VWSCGRQLAGSSQLDTYGCLMSLLDHSARKDREAVKAVNS